MIDNSIINLFEQFSKKNKLVYDQTALPYRPFGAIKGKIKSHNFQIYIYTPESRVSRGFVTVFGIPVLDLLPKGFCIEHVGFPYYPNKPFYKQIKIRSYDEDIVTNYLNDRIKDQLIDALIEINNHENSLFKLRCTFRLSDEGLFLTVGRLFEDIDELNKAYLSVIPLLSSLTLILSELPK